MSTKAIREALGKFSFLAEHEGATDDVSLSMAALSEVEAIERAARLSFEQIESMMEECSRRAVLDPQDVLDGLERLQRIASQAK